MGRFTIFWQFLVQKITRQADYNSMTTQITLKRHPLTHEYLAFCGNIGINVRVFKKPHERNWQVGQAYTSDYQGMALRTGNTFADSNTFKKCVRLDQAIEWITEQFVHWRNQ